MPRKAGMLLVFSVISMIMSAIGLAATVETEVDSVALFKNGLAFFIRNGELPDQPGDVEIGPLPAASHGTFWVGWSSPVQLSNLTAKEVLNREERGSNSRARCIPARASS